jgi:uncharacterized membrane protein YfcA
VEVDLLILIPVVLIAGFVVGVTGMGFVIVSAGVLSLLVSPKAAIVLMSIMVPPVTVVQLFHHRAHAQALRPLAPLLVMSAVGVLIGVVLFSVLPARIIGALMGAVILSFVALRLLGRVPEVSAAHARIAGPAIGLVGGVLSSTSGLSGPLFATYLVALRTPPRPFAFTINAIYSVLTAVRLIGFAITGAVTATLLLMASALLAPALVGQWLGLRFQHARSVKTLELAVLALLLLTGLKLLFDALVG